MTGARVRPDSPKKDNTMNSDIIKGKWKQLNGKIKTQWGKLTDDDLKIAEGTREYLAGKVQERYGVTKEAALKQVEDFEKTIKES
jgi:uncharacterized protein YjbJ (UPF0337 family)